ncbi:MAG: response regulator transcription factor [Planctomycetota bacterium]
MSRVLVIEDDPAVAKGLEDNLRFESLAVVVAGSAEEGLALLRSRAFDLLLLDLMLPGANGFEVLRELRVRPDAPRVIVLSARDGEADIVRALDLGAHDYVRKPFGLPEVLARVRRQLRDTAAPRADTSFADVRVSLRRYRLWKGSVEHALSHTEAGMLRLFLRRPDEPLRRAEIIEEVWGADAYPTERTVDNFVLKLRRMIEDDPSRPRLLRTVHGVGYCFTPAAR